MSHTGICAGHYDDIYAANYLDIDFIRDKRRSNAEVIINKIGCMFELKEQDCPLFVPIITEKLNMLRKYLIDHQVYCPVHWPRNSLGNKELSLICDQRYDIEDMEYICSLILNFREENK